MPDDRSPIEYSRALEDFRQARSKAEMRHLWASITGESTTLLRYDEISKKMHARGTSSKGLQDIPVSAIVGSVNRYQDFDRNFLPLHNVDMERWARVKSVMTSPGSVGLPPIRVYQLGDAYFVLDGNHRVSIARQMGIETVEAYVTEIRAKVNLSPDDTPEEIILKEEYAAFLDETNVDQIIPDVDLRLTFPGLYPILQEHIRVHRHYMGIESSREISWEEAVRHWFEQVYQPVVKVIREQDILLEFPEHTETDLYLWVLDHQTYLQEEMGWSIRPEKAASDLFEQRRAEVNQFFGRLRRNILRTLSPKELEGYATTGGWHAYKQLDDQPLFSDILVAMDGSAESWLALEQAVVVAALEGSDVRGLVIKRGTASSMNDDPDDLSKAFSECLAQSNLTGNLAYTEGPVAETIIQRAKVNDLVVLRLNHPPASKVFARLGSGIRTIVRRCTRPILMVPDQLSLMNRLLLAYDGSPKGKEALFIAHYLAKSYGKKVHVLVVEDDPEHGNALLSEAQAFLGEYATWSAFRQPSGSVSDIILGVAQENYADIIVMGGYGLSPIFEIVLGSTVDGVLRHTRLPVLICQ